MAARSRKTRLAVLEEVSPSSATVPDLQAEIKTQGAKDPMTEIDACLQQMTFCF
jgi:hypothetical protein